MRHKSSLPAQYFNEMFAQNPDPWQFETSAYEKAKYDRTLAALPKPRFRRALEIGCANGVLTERLAAYCDILIAVDIADPAVDRARQRCAALANVDIRKASLPTDRIEGPFDLILLSEVAYYWDSNDIREAAGYFRRALSSAGYILLVHWTGETDYPKSADEAVSELKSALNGGFVVATTYREPAYRLDLWQHSDPT
jgi:SAM-dependent methyltransferase